MNEEKLITKLIKKAEKIDNVEISIPILDVADLEKFYDEKGELYYFEKEQTFYKNHINSWLRFKLKNKDSSINYPIYATKESVDELYDWATKLKEAMESRLRELDSTIEKLEKEQEEYFREIKQNIDLKLKLMDDKNGNTKNI